MRFSRSVTCGICRTEREDQRLKPAHDGGITRILCDTCGQITAHQVKVTMDLKLLGSQSGEAGFTALIWQNVADGRVFFVSDHDEDNDGPGGSIEQDPDWQPETTLQHNGKSIDSRKVAGVVVPSWLPRAVGPIVMGCQAFVTNLATGHREPAVTYDLGPTRKSGEGSNLLCKRIGAAGGENRPVFLFEIYPGQAATVDGVTYELQLTHSG